MNNYQIIRTLAKEKKITLKEISIQAGISEQGLQKIINDGTGKVTTLQKIATALMVPLSDILNHDQEDKNILNELPPTYKHTRSLNDVSEIDYLQQVVRDKERIIELLEKQLSDYEKQLNKGQNDRKSKLA